MQESRVSLVGFIRGLLILILLSFSSQNIFAWENMPMPRLHVEGRNLVDFRAIDAGIVVQKL